MNAVFRLSPFGIGSPGRPPVLLAVCWLGFVVSIAAYVTEFLLADRLPGVGPLLAVLALTPCGFAWLFARALFRTDARSERWPALLVGVLFVVSLVLYVNGGGAANGLMGYLGNVQAMLGSAMLLLTLVEALDTRDVGRGERQFRVAFAIGYLFIMATSIVARLPELALWQDTVQVLLATLALVFGTAAYRYRQRNPITARKKSATTPNRAAQPELAARITELIEREQVYLEADCKVADLADLVGQPDYRVSQCIVSDLGYANFNQLVNRYRVDAAKAMLAAREPKQRPILTIAMACGFASLGPFNRAFKAQTGQTPSAYRARCQSNPPSA